MADTGDSDAVPGIRLDGNTGISMSGGEVRLGQVLESIVEHGRDLVNASTFLVLLDDRGRLIVAAAAGAVGPDARGMHLPADGAAWRGTMVHRVVERTAAIEPQLRRSLAVLGLSAEAALLVPLTYQQRALGVLAAFDRVGDEVVFSAKDQSLMTGFAASAAMAVATAQTLSEARLRDSIEIAERERGRWARELHDETLQGLGALRLRLASSLRGKQEDMAEAIVTAIEQIDDEIANLRSLITELRPAALDELGLGAALESLAAGHGAATDQDVVLELTLGWEAGWGGKRLSRELESTIYRVVQEALTNVAKHSSAARVWVSVTQDDDAMVLSVRDDGAGFDMDKRSQGFGLIGMRERVALHGGSLSIVSTPGRGTELRGRVPVGSEPGPESSRLLDLGLDS